jgi:hypothetical protein
MPEIPEYLRLCGDEDGGVSLDCYHSACDPYHHGSIAYYGGPLDRSLPYFTSGHLADFFDFIREHARTHGESF